MRWAQIDLLTYLLFSSSLPCLLLSSLFLPFPSILSLPPLSLDLHFEVGPLNPAMGYKGLGSAVSPLAGSGQSPSENRFWCILAFKPDIWCDGNIFNDFPENQLPKFHPLPAGEGSWERCNTLQ